MKAQIGHIGINISPTKKSFDFWKELLEFLDFKLVKEGMWHVDAGDGKSYLCVNATGAIHAEHGFHRKRIGLNHLAFRVASRKLVNQFVDGYLKPWAIEPLYGGPKAYPDYGAGYYAVYFEDPDRIKVEVVYEPTQL